MVYDAHVRRELHKCRIRYDILDFTEEMWNNDMRNMGYAKSFHFPSNNIYKYFNNLDVNAKDTYFYVLNGWACDWPNYQADEVCTEGMYDCTWKVPPVPENGVYEIRMGVFLYYIRWPKKKKAGILFPCIFLIHSQKRFAVQGVPYLSDFIGNAFKFAKPLPEFRVE